MRAPTSQLGFRARRPFARQMASFPCRCRSRPVAWRGSAGWVEETGLFPIARAAAQVLFRLQRGASRVLAEAGLHRMGTRIGSLDHFRQYSARACVGKCTGVYGGRQPVVSTPRSLLLFQQRQQIVCCGALAQAWEDFVDAVLVRKGVHISHCIHSEDDVISMFVSMTGS